jgi:aminoglycoside phosphotransferase (APT) family kinase protein
VIDAARAIERAFPELAPAEVIALGSGVDNEAFLVNGAWVFRFARGAHAVPYLEREIAFTPMLAARLPITIAAARLVCRDPSIHPFPFAGHAYIEGMSAESIALDPFAAALAAFLRALHAVDPGDVEVPDLAGKADFARGVERIDRWSNDAPDRAAIMSLAEQLARTPPDRAPCWVHGDLYARHLVIRDASIAGVIDWGDVHVGDRALDLSVAFSFDDPARFFDAYGPIDDAMLDRARFRALTYGVFFVYVATEPSLRSLGARYLARLIDRTGLDGASRPPR